MSLYAAIKHARPGIRDDEFRLRDDGEGAFIEEWTHASPRPTARELVEATLSMEPSWAYRLRAEFRDERELLANRLGTIAGRMQRQGQPEFAAAIDAMVVAILPLDTDPYVLEQTAISYDAGRAAYKTRYRQIAQAALAQAPGMPEDTTVALQWKAEVDKMFPKD
jgi:hypothetical protein